MSFSNDYETKILQDLFSGSQSAFPQGVSFGLLKKLVGGNPVEDGNLVEIANTGGYARATLVGVPTYFSNDTSAKLEGIEQHLLNLANQASSNTSGAQRTELQNVFEFVLNDLFNNTPEIWQAGNSYTENSSQYSWSFPHPNTSSGTFTLLGSGSFEWGASSNYTSIIATSISQVTSFFQEMWDWHNNPQTGALAYSNNTNTWSLNYNMGVLESVSNQVSIPFVDATGNWEQAEAFGVFADDGNTLMLWAEFASPITILDGQKLIFNPGELTIMLN